MKDLVLLIFCFIVGEVCSGQSKLVSENIYSNGNSIISYLSQREKFEKAGLPDLIKSTDTLHFRVSSMKQAIDIWTKDYITFYGTLTNFTTSYEGDRHKRKNKKANKFYSDKKSIDTATAKRIYGVFVEKSIFEIPLADSIKGWSTNGRDGTSYYVEKSTKNDYLFKDYWSPSTFKDKIDEAKRLHELTEELEKLLCMNESFGQFIQSLPYGTYTSDGFGVIMIAKKKKRIFQ
jgi:hypothetical protein